MGEIITECPNCKGKTVVLSGCPYCPNCGWSQCDLNNVKLWKYL